MSSDEFRKSMSNIKPLHQDKIIPFKKIKPTADIRKQNAPHVSSDIDTIDSLSDQYDPFNDDYQRNNLNYFQPSFGEQKFKQFRTGSFNEEAVLDLHGHSKSEARIEISRFINYCQHNNIKKVLVIPGQGHGILRLALNAWLRQISAVLAYAESPQSHGGRGVIRLQLVSDKQSHAQ